MREYEEWLYEYIMEKRFRELYDDREYQILREIRRRAEETLETALTEEQRELFHTYEEQENAVDAAEMRHVFRESLVLGVRMSQGC